jgi:carbamoyltransferase
VRVLGLAAYYHDSAAALVADGAIVAAAQEERFTRRRHDASFPRGAIEACLQAGRCDLGSVDRVVFYDKPFLKFDRLLETYLAFAPRGFRSFRIALPVWLREKLFLKDLLVSELRAIAPGFTPDRLLFSEHHLSHAASAFYPSPYQDAAILTMDGVGEWATTSLAVGHGNAIEIRKEIHFPHSLGLLYSAFTYYAGFKVNSGEYKLMGLAPYGRPRFASLIRDHLIDLKEDGSFQLELSYFEYCTGLTMVGERFAQLLGQPPRRPEAPLTEFTMDVAASIQAVIEEAVLGLARAAARETGAPNLCLAGGVALNCVANGRLLRERIFDGVWVQPAAGDAGGALGAALIGHHVFGGQPRSANGHRDAMRGAYLGPAYPQADVERRLSAAGARFTVLDEWPLLDTTARALAAGSVVGWMQGPMEFGPRALGARSILADPRSPLMQHVLNVRVKQREPFRPFAPSILREQVDRWFELDRDSPYMLFVAPVREEQRVPITEDESRLSGLDRLRVRRSTIPSVTHVDYSARIQTVDAVTNPLYHALISRFFELTGCPLLVNTSFNVRGEPIVNTPEEAFRCFLDTNIDLLVVGACVLAKTEQDPSLKRDPPTSFERD